MRRGSSCSLCLALSLVLGVIACGAEAPSVEASADDAGASDATSAADAAATLDAANPDSGEIGSDAGGVLDASTPTDAGTPDAGTPDAGTPDAGTPDAGTPDAGTPTPDAGTPLGSHIQTVFLILMENHNWDSISGNTTEAPYINNTLLPMAARAENYTGNAHPSEPNYIWLMAGNRLGVYNDSPPSSNSQTTHDHLPYLLNAAGISWREYAEGIPGTDCPLVDVGTLYKPKHNPFVFFEDLTGGNDPNDADCIAHNRPYDELLGPNGDLAQNTVARFNFITPNMCNDMHDDCSSTGLAQGDAWLSSNIPLIMNSAAYQNNGAIFITFDESEITLSCVLGTCPIMMMVLSPLAKAGGYSNTISYNHNSTLKSLQEIFGVTPLLGHAGDMSVDDLADLFTSFP